MCGIAGLYLKREDVTADRLNRVAQTLHHRGPDGQGLFAERRVGLVYVRSTFCGANSRT